MERNLPHLLLIQSGSTELDLQGRIVGRIDLPLCPRGVEQATRLADETSSVHIVAIYSDPCAAARETAEILARSRAMSAKTDKRLMNIDFGLWQCKSLDELRKNQPEVYRNWLDRPECVCAPGGEDSSSVSRRIGQFLEKIAKKFPDEIVAVVVTPPIARVIARQYGECSAKHFGSFCECDNGASEGALWELLPGQQVPQTQSSRPFRTLTHNFSAFFGL